MNSESSPPRWTWMVAILAVVAAAAVAVALSLPDDDTTAGSGVNDRSADRPAPEESYVSFLASSGLFPDNVADARDVWIRAGRDACILLKSTGDVVATRLEIYRTITEYSRGGAADSNVAERAVAVVDGASRFLCPEVPAS